MKKIIECVPNFSEGRDREKIREVTNEIEKVEGVKLLDVALDPDHNRTVVTFAGEPRAVKEAAFRTIAKAAQVIDMREHTGEHPRLGATDVCPFVPVGNTTMEECVRLARELGKEVAEKLNIPVYLYEEAATKPERKNLATIRRGEYEGLPEKLKDPAWRPDFGPARFNPKSGATVIGAREFLVAFNVNLTTQNLALAKAISRVIRESGQVIKLEDGTKTRIPGALKFVKAIGVALGDCVQVSANLTNYKITPVHVVYEAIKRIAEIAGVEVIGSEIIGLVPREALIMVGRAYLPGETSHSRHSTELSRSLDSGLSAEEKLIQAAIDNLGLNKIGKFVPEEKIIECMI